MRKRSARKRADERSSGRGEGDDARVPEALADRLAFRLDLTGIAWIWSVQSKRASHTSNAGYASAQLARKVVEVQ